MPRERQSPGGSAQAPVPLGQEWAEEGSGGGGSCPMAAQGLTFIVKLISPEPIGPSYFSCAVQSPAIHGVILKQTSKSVVRILSFQLRAPSPWVCGAAVRLLPRGISIRVAPYRTFPAEFSRTTLESTAVSDLSGRWEQNPMPT